MTVYMYCPSTCNYVLCLYSSLTNMLLSSTLCNHVLCLYCNIIQSAVNMYNRQEQQPLSRVTNMLLFSSYYVKLAV